MSQEHRCFCAPSTFGTNIRRMAANYGIPVSDRDKVYGRLKKLMSLADDLDFDTYRARICRGFLENADANKKRFGLYLDQTIDTLNEHSRLPHIESQTQAEEDAAARGGARRRLDPNEETVLQLHWTNNISESTNASLKRQLNYKTGTMWQVIEALQTIAHKQGVNVTKSVYGQGDYRIAPRRGSPKVVNQLLWQRWGDEQKAAKVESLFRQRGRRMQSRAEDYEVSSDAAFSINLQAGIKRKPSQTTSGPDKRARGGRRAL